MSTRRGDLPGGSRRSDDRGSVLALVLVMSVIGMLVVLPVMSYMVAVLRANQVVGERNAESEAVKAGFRYAMAEPHELYDECSSTSGRTLVSPGLDIATHTECFLIDSAPAVEPADLPYSVATTFSGVAAPAEGGGVLGPIFPGSGDSDATAWVTGATVLGDPATVWLPNLPVHGRNIRSSAGHTLPTSFEVNGYETDGRDCKIYFPGRYPAPVVIDSTAFFTSGVYYFEAPVTLSGANGGADVIAGEGAELGCGNNQHALFYSSPPAPTTHNITGIGATFVFGDEGRLIVDDTDGPVRLRMNQRYVKPTDTGVLPSAGVSIMSVNGDLDPALEASDFPNSGIDLVLPGPPEAPQLAVPLSKVDSVDPRPATVDYYRPSVLTPEQREPSAPLNVVGTEYDQAVVVSWDAPDTDGGLPIDQYLVTSSPGGLSCATDDELSCAVTGLTNGQAYTFSVVATNGLGDSAASDPSPTYLPSSSDPTLLAPTAPPNLRIEESLPLVSQYPDAFVVSWDPEPHPDAAPVTDVDVSVVNLETADEADCVLVSPTSCVLDGPSASTLGYEIRAVAVNDVGSSAPSVLGVVTLALTGDAYEPPPVVPHPPYVPPAIIDIDLATANPVEVVIPGYVAVPQGVVRIEAAVPAGKQVQLAGGVLAAWVDLGPLRPADFDFGIVNPDVQRIIRIVTTTPESRITSEAIVQVNQNGGSAVNSWVVQ